MLSGTLGRPDQTMLTQVSGLPKEQYDQGLHCLFFLPDLNNHFKGQLQYIGLQVKL